MHSSSIMNSFNGYADKENLRIGKPVVKESEVDRVKRNLAIPFQVRNQFEQNNNSSPASFLSGRPGVNSPITELTYNFTELAAHETSGTFTPKRRLSLNSSTGSGSVTPELCQPFSCSTSSDNSDTSIISESGSATNYFDELLRKSAESRNRQGAFRRYKSMPHSSSHHSNEASPQLYLQTSRPLHQISPLVTAETTSQSQQSFFLGNDETSRDSQDSGIGKDERFQFVAPTIPPERAQFINEQSPLQEVTATDSRVVGSPELCDITSQDFSESPLLAHRLCSQSGDEETDDGFVDLAALESQCVNDVPPEIANMLTGKLLATSAHLQPKKPVTNFRGNLFRSPSMPQRLGSSKDYNIQRRVLCGSKRPDPPNDGNTPLAAVKKRRGLISDGDMPPVPSKLRVSPLLSLNRLQRCRSMVEQSVSFQMNKHDTDGITGDFKKCCLPLIIGKNADLNNISHETMAQILNGAFDDRLSDYTVVDCRYPYEFNGGHIKGAENIYTKEDIFERCITQCKLASNRPDNKRSILIFHCEFSSERAPKLSRFLRNHDREINTDHYPSLYHPELYLLEGGYKVFFENHKGLCVPNTYTPMLHKDHSEDLKTFRAKSKSWAGAEKRGGFRPGLSKRL